jgi:thiamine biosynthesis lipoprotein ApbE
MQLADREKGDLGLITSGLSSLQLEKNTANAQHISDNKDGNSSSQVV